MSSGGSRSMGVGLLLPKSKAFNQEMTDIWKTDEVGSWSA